MMRLGNGSQESNGAESRGHRRPRESRDTHRTGVGTGAVTRQTLVRGSLAAGIALAVLGCASGAVAQVLPGTIPGGVEQEQQRQQRRFEQQAAPPRQQGPAVVSPSRAPTDLLKPGGPKFRLRGIKFEGESKFLSKEELDGAIAPYVGRNVDFSDLQKILAVINELYTEKGVVTGIATLPPQEASGGVVRIKLTEGRLGKFSITGRQQTSENFITQRVPPPKAGEVLDVPKLSRDVTWFNRTNDVQLRALLQPGTTFGLTDVQLAVAEIPTDTLQMFFDNQGVQSTGRYEGGLYYRRSGTLGIDDRFTFYGTKSEGNLNGNVSYNLPINVWGGRLGVSYTQGAIKIIQGPFKTLDVTGQSKSGSVNFSQPVFVNDAWLVQANLAGTYGISQSDLSSFRITDDRSTKATTGFSVTNSAADHSVTFAPAVNFVQSHSEVTNIERPLTIYSATWNLFWQLPANFSVAILGSGQYTQDKLLPGDQLFQIGGPTTVRGFPTNSVAGDSGFYTNFELHYNLSSIIQGLDVYGFIDRGDVYSTFPAHTALKSAGAGLSWRLSAPLMIEASAGMPWEKVVPQQPRYQAYFRVIFRPLLLADQH